MNIKVNPIVKKQAEEVLSRLGIPMSTAVDIYLNQIALTDEIPFTMTLPKAPVSINADLMSVKEIRTKLQEGYENIKEGRVQDASPAFAKFRENH